LVQPTRYRVVVLTSRHFDDRLLRQSRPAIKIVLPERFRVLSQQLFDLRAEAVGLTNSAAQLQIVVNDGNKHDALQVPTAAEI